MTNFNDIARTIVDQNNNSTWTGSVYALKDLLMFVNNNQDLKNNTEIGKKLNEISKQTGFDIT